MATVERFERGWIHRPDKIKATMLLSHGAGGNCQAPLMVSVAEAFAEAALSGAPAPLPLENSIATARLLDRIREAA